ncbi:MAG TPA: DsbA family protein [Hyphomicrobiaceae bacterium]|nr:DsbA family protein [Hyphomicrobiaceae bacterium]
MAGRPTLPALVIAAAVAVGCTGDGPTLPTLSGMSEVAAALQSGTTPDGSAYDPFSERPLAATAGRREVIENPSIADIMQPGDLPEMALGRPDAPVTIVQYASMTCPYCRQFQIETFPVLKREYIDTGKVRYVLRAEFPIGKQSGLATIALRCAPPEKYFVLYDKLMRQQATWVSQEVRPDPIFNVARQVGMTRAQFDSCRENRAMIDSLNAIKERGRTLGIIGTPNFFVQGKLVKSVLGIKEIREMVDPILADRVAASAAKPKAR